MFGSPPSPLSALIVAGLFIYYGFQDLFEWMARKPVDKNKKYSVPGPFVDLNVNPVSEGDEVCYAINLDGRFIALVENKRKHAKLTLEADSQQELRQKVADTFRAWSITGKKRK